MIGWFVTFYFRSPNFTSCSPNSPIVCSPCFMFWVSLSLFSCCFYFLLFYISFWALVLFMFLHTHAYRLLLHLADLIFFMSPLILIARLLFHREVGSSSCPLALIPTYNSICLSSSKFLQALGLQVPVPQHAACSVASVSSP